MPITLEKAKPSHLQEVQQLNKLLFEKEIKDFDPSLNADWPFSSAGTEYFTNAITKDHYLCFVALDEEKVVGYIAGHIDQNDIPWRKIGKHGEISNMLLLPEYRNLKIGSQLIQRFLDWAKENKLVNVQVMASAQNEGAINFYHKHGFKDYDLTLEINL